MNKLQVQKYNALGQNLSFLPEEAIKLHLFVSRLKFFISILFWTNPRQACSVCCKYKRRETQQKRVYMWIQHHSENSIKSDNIISDLLSVACVHTAGQREASYFFLLHSHKTDLVFITEHMKPFHKEVIFYSTPGSWYRLKCLLHLYNLIIIIGTKVKVGC